MNTVIVAGFGSFDNVVNNPSSAVAVALNGCVYGNIQIVGREMPVSYARSVDVCEMWVKSSNAVGLVGIGVALDRTEVTVERTGTRPDATAREDIDGRTPECFEPTWPDSVESTCDTTRLATLLDAAVGDDAGGYVCNAWLYQAVRRIDVPVAFIHVPPMGLDSGKLLSAIQDLWGESGS